MASDSTPRPTTLGSALRGIPLPTPPRDGWESLQATIAARRAGSRQAPRRRHRWLAGMAVAASLGLVAVLIVPAQQDAPGKSTPTPESAATDAAPANGEFALNALIARSGELEAQLAWLEDAPRDGDALGVDLALIDRLQWVDQLLSSDPGSPDTAEVLWRERIQLLSRRLALSQSESLIASIRDSATAPTL